MSSRPFCGLRSVAVELERPISRCGRQIKIETLTRSDTLRACQVPALCKDENA
jgi:hypothetical protein